MCHKQSLHYLDRLRDHSCAPSLKQSICLQFGEIDIDSELVASKESLPDSGDQIMMLNNGCMCCTVKEDLVEMLNDLVNSLAHETCWVGAWGWGGGWLGWGWGWGNAICSLMPAKCCIIW